jgi:hypothetical protein
VGENAGKSNSHILLMGMQASTIPMENSMEVLQKRDLPYDPSIQLLGIYPKECESGYRKSTCMR